MILPFRTSVAVIHPKRLDTQWCGFFLALLDLRLDKAGKCHIYHCCCIKRSPAHFATVSDVTTYEPAHLFKQKPGGVFSNGLNIVKSQAMPEFQDLRAQF
ncbi:glycosyltransferase family 3 protein [Botryobasidium botryosum FD-172 SS1]|uniref:Glycogen [starch] synthase n=1 Tax=Botryobasidium botryosum (strain FD-172 SS1) TaxID=930990 RepID=A0A067N338_BOTB1|nr:glycosyltransferase family 3 protein [Botryobasidium botryosum FD-172 SS1]